MLRRRYNLGFSSSFGVGREMERITFKVENLQSVDNLISGAIAEHEVLIKTMLRDRINEFAICLVIYTTAGYSRLVGNGVRGLVSNSSDGGRQLERFAKMTAQSNYSLFTEEEILRKMRARVKKDAERCVKSYIRDYTQTALRSLQGR